MSATEVRPLRVLDFDLENRPLTYLGSDYTTADVTVVAAQTVGKPRSLQVWALGESSAEAMLEGFLEAYSRCDMVTGHNIRRHDLPHLNGMSLELGFGPLPPKLCQDTYADLKRRSGISGSQESLAGLLGVKAAKKAMSQTAWRRANRLLPEGIAEARARCVSDVRQHIALRARLLELDWLNPPRIWGS